MGNDISRRPTMRKRVPLHCGDGQGYGRPTPGNNVCHAVRLNHYISLAL